MTNIKNEIKEQIAGSNNVVENFENLGEMI
jgi:hypothetical protein